MYKQRDDLVKLIESLTSSEKRNFTNRFMPDRSIDELPLYLQLYIELENGKSQLSKINLLADGRAITAAKRRLYDNIMESLVSLYGEQSVNTVIQHQLSSIEILFSKGLSEQAMVIWRKSYALCFHDEKYSLLLQLLDWENRLNIVLDKPSRSSQLIKDEEDKTIAKIKQILVLERIYSHIMVFKKQHGFVKGKLQELLESETIQSPEMPAERQCLSLKAIYYRNLIWSIYYWMVFNHEKAYSHSKGLLLDSKENILPNDYINGIFQHITSSVCLGMFKDTLNGIRLASAYLEEYHLDQSISFKSMMFAYQSTYSIIAYNYMGDRAKLKKTIQETERKLDDFKAFLPLELRKIVLGNLMNAYAGIGDMNQADKLWLLMNDKQYRDVRQDINADLYFFRLFSLLSQKAYSLIPSAALSAFRFYAKSEDAKNKYVVELPIAQLLKKERDYGKSGVIEELIAEIQGILQDYINRISPNLHFQEHYSRYIIWCDVLLNGRSYHLAANEWYRSLEHRNKNMLLRTVRKT